MRIWRKTAQKESSGRGLARAALDGASRQELLQEAMKALAQEGLSGRLGVWLATDSNATPHDEIAAGLHYALWVPIEWKEQLKGIILWGSTGKPPDVSRQHAESIAAELALALGLEELQRIARIRDADLGVLRRFLSRQATDSSLHAQLSNLVDGCTRGLSNEERPGAAFAVIGALPLEIEKSGDGFPVEFRWRSGDESWTRAIESEPLAGVWRRALQSRRVIGSDPETGWMQSTVVRIIAFPLELEGQLLGVLVAGLRSSAISLTTLDRLALRAVLAAFVLEQRRRKEEESRFAGQQDALLECISEPLLILDDDGRIRATSRGARELTGAVSRTKGPRQTEIPMRGSLSEMFRPHDQAQVETWLRAGLAREAGKPEANLELPRAELHNGVAVRLSFVAPAQGTPTAILLEPLAARESSGLAGTAEIELQNVIEWLEEGVILFDAQDNIHAMNTRFEQIAGLAPQESGKFKTLEGLLGRLQVHAAEPAWFAARWRELARGIQGGVREEFQMMHPAPRLLERAARPILDPTGRRLGRVEIYRDLTAQRVFHSKLLQTEKLAALGQMVSGVAHELSNPLTSILGYAHRLLARQDLPGRTEELRQIYQEAERAGAILRQLLLNARETLPERRPVSLNQIVHRAMDLQRFSLAAEKIRLEIDLDPALPFVQGDPGHLQQVLMNLVGNARQAIEQNGQGGTIRLRTKRISEKRVLLEVADNGPGIAQ